jgi:N-acetylglucosamine PTS system EIICBA or EIICB component
MYHCARPERRRAVGGLLASMVLTSILTGVTEPIEFSFMFLAPALYGVHALLTGVAFILMNALHVKLGFNFSAGLIDYLLDYRYATRPLLLMPVGALYFALYYFLFRLVIVRFDLHTPGRGAEIGNAAPEAAARAPQAADPGRRAAAYIAALGGAVNIVSVDACTTRLRLGITSQDGVDGPALARLGARGLVRPAPNALQVVVGMTADQLAGEIRAALRSANGTPAANTVPAPPASRGSDAAPPGAQALLPDAGALLAALGGPGNVRAVQQAASRLLVNVGDAARVDRNALGKLRLRGIALPVPDCVHVIVGPDAARLAQVLQQLIASERRS